MSAQASVHSIDDLKDFRVALALYGEDTLGALGAVESEVRRTRPLARGGTARSSGKSRSSGGERPSRWPGARSSAATCRNGPGYSPPMSEQKEALRTAEASLQDAEKRLAAVRKWQPRLRQAVLEYHGSVQRLKDLAAADVPNAVNLLTRIVEALEAYLQRGPAVRHGPGRRPRIPRAEIAAPAQFIAIATKVLDEDARPPRRKRRHHAAEPVTRDDAPATVGRGILRPNGELPA